MFTVSVLVQAYPRPCLEVPSRPLSVRCIRVPGGSSRTNPYLREERPRSCCMLLRVPSSMSGTPHASSRALRHLTKCSCLILWQAHWSISDIHLVRSNSQASFVRMLQQSRKVAFAHQALLGYCIQSSKIRAEKR